MTRNQRKAFIEREHPSISISRQADLLDVSRSSIYYLPDVNKEDVAMMHCIDEIYTAHPFYGSRRIQEELKEYGIAPCRERVQRLMRIMGLQAIYPKRQTSIPAHAHRIYPYLLSGVLVTRANQVWGTDITYVRLEKGFAYLSAILDWFSRYILAWELSASLDASFCITALKRALSMSVPEIHNSDQGSQYTDAAYTAILKEYEVHISMDGKGRYVDNIFTERLWRTVKYENIYLQSYRDIHEARQGLCEYFIFYNQKRKHQSLNYHTPEEIYFSKVE